MDLQHENENAQDQVYVPDPDLSLQGEIRMSTTLDPRACKLKVSCAEAEEAGLELTLLPHLLHRLSRIRARSALV